MLLKFKSIIYKYTGIYLANKERNNFIFTNEFWEEFGRIWSHPNNNMSSEKITGLLQGMFECKHGFARPMSFLKFREPRWFFKILAWFDELYQVLKWDIWYMYRSLKK